jgi:hypothetical protein
MWRSMKVHVLPLVVAFLYCAVNVVDTALRPVSRYPEPLWIVYLAPDTERVSLAATTVAPVPDVTKLIAHWSPAVVGVMPASRMTSAIPLAPIVTVTTGPAPPPPPRAP